MAVGGTLPVRRSALVGPGLSDPGLRRDHAAGTGLTGRVGYLTATNVAYRRHGFPGYDTVLTQGGDEVDLLRRLTAWGPVLWDGENVVGTSARRFRLGFLHTLVISYGWYYLASSLVNRLTGSSGDRVGTPSPLTSRGDLRCIMSGVIGRLEKTVFDCPDPALLAAFYAQILGMLVLENEPDWVVIGREAAHAGAGFPEGRALHRPAVA